MKNENALFEFFAAENDRDWERYAQYLHQDVEWRLFTAFGCQVIQGLDNYMAKIMTAYEGSQDSFICDQHFSSQSGSRIVTVLHNNYGQQSVDIFDFEDGLIKHEYEFLLSE